MTRPSTAETGLRLLEEEYGQFDTSMGSMRIERTHSEAARKSGTAAFEASAALGY